MNAALRIGLAAAIAGVFCLCCVAAALAHFNLNMNVRVIHVEHVGEGLLLYLRTPMPYLVADKTGPVGADGLPEAAPFTSNRAEEDRIVHLVDAAALRRNPLGLGKIAADGLHLEADGREAEPILIAVRAYPIGKEPGFATLEEAKAALRAGPPFPEGAPETYVGDTVVDVLLKYDGLPSIAEYELSSQLDPGQSGQEETANLILDHGPGGTKVFRARGLLREPVRVTRSSYSAAITFIWEGVRHILGGPDHVLFVLCLVLGATGLKSLIARVTGFTVGHSVTLTAGFFGFVPKGAWFCADRRNRHCSFNRLRGCDCSDASPRARGKRADNVSYYLCDRIVARAGIFLRPA